MCVCVHVFVRMQVLVDGCLCVVGEKVGGEGVVVVVFACLTSSDIIISQPSNSKICRHRDECRAVIQTQVVRQRNCPKSRHKDNVIYLYFV